MPRKKPKKPEPIETVLINGGDEDILFEIYDEEDWPKDRGWNNQLPYIEKFNRVLERMSKDYLTPAGRRRIPPNKDYMSSGTAFSAQCQLWGLTKVEGTDDSSLRKKLYKDLRAELEILTNALDQKDK